MERQYVGARYVPVFAEPLEWDNHRSFERLTIVTYLGSSYTSKKDVPPGILPTNTEYWALTGNYNAQVEQYRQEVKNTVSTLTEKYYIFLGDSYGQISDNWVEQCVDIMGIKNDRYVNACVSGGGFNCGVSYLAQLQGVNSKFLSKATDIVVCGGINDAQESVYEGLPTAMSVFFAWCKNNIPNAKIHVGYIGFTKSTAEYSAKDYYRQCFVLYWYHNAKYNYNYLNNIEYAVRLTPLTLTSADGVHPSASGSEEIAKAVAISLTGNGYNATFPEAELAPYFFTQPFNEMRRIRFNDFKYNMNGNDYTEGTPIVVSSISTGVTFNSPVTCNVMCDLYDSDGRKGVKGVLTFADNNIYLKVYSLEGGTNEPRVFSGVQVFGVYAGELYVPNFAIN